MIAGMMSEAPIRSSLRIRCLSERLSGLLTRLIVRKTKIVTTAIAPMGRLEEISCKSLSNRTQKHLLDVKAPSP